MIHLTAKGAWLQENVPLLNAALKDEDFRSKITPRYNCVGYAIADPHWWEPSGDEAHLWPEDLETGDYRLSTFIEFFGRYDFTPCDANDPAFGVDKIAIFCATDGTFEHVAIRPGNGEPWISKLGWYEDITHPIEPIAGKFYGELCQCMKHLRALDRVTTFPL